MQLKLRHIELREANAFVARQHRHHGPIQGHRFSIAAYLGDTLVGVVIVGRPVGGQHAGDWCEVTRLCTDGTKNACSFLYSAAARAARELGFDRIQTFILLDETGVSLRAAGWQFERRSHPTGWHHGPASDADQHPLAAFFHSERSASTRSNARPARRVAATLKGRKQLWFKDTR